MSDPPKKPGSLRDRIAAFEKGGGSPPAPGPAPVPRPKPAGGVQWKPRPRSPPPSEAPSSVDDNHAAAHAGGMSASDAKESIGKGVSLKDRMAALQGLGGFGGAPPPPKPATEKPKWKPPPVVTPPIDDDDEPQVAKDAVEPSSEAHIKPTADDERGAEPEDSQAEPDPHEEERQRRAALAARMARLGGARVGMAPPVFGRKPEVKAEAHKDEDDKSADAQPISAPTSPPTSAAESPHKPGTESSTDSFEAKDSSPSLLSPDSGSSASVRSSHMPVPTGPRRAAPPRRRPAKSPSPAPPVLGEGVEESPSPMSTPALGSAATESLVEIAEAGAQSSEVVVEHVEVVSQDAQSVETGLNQLLTEDSPVKVISHDVTESENLVEAEEPVISQPSMEYDTTTPPTIEHTEPAPLAIADPEEHVEDIIAEGMPTEEADSPVEQVEAVDEEEDEAVRRKRIAERLANAGGVNPLSGRPLPSSPPPVAVERRTSYRRDSKDSEVLSPSSPIEIPVRNGSTDSMGIRPGVADRSLSPSISPIRPKRESLGRKGSVGSVNSSGGVEPPTRRMSQDDQRTVLSKPALTEEPHEAIAPKALERSSEDAEAAPHATDEAAHDLQSVLEEEESHDGYEPDDQPIGDNGRVQGEAYEESDDHSAYSDYEVLQEESVHEDFASSPVSVEVPPPPLPPTRPAQVTVIDVPPLPPPVPATARPPVKKLSLPPPPRAPPALPRDEVHRKQQNATFSLPVRKASLPPIPPEPVSTYSIQGPAGHASTNVAVSRKSFDTDRRRSLSPPIEYPPEEEAQYHLSTPDDELNYEVLVDDIRFDDTDSPEAAHEENVMSPDDAGLQEEQPVDDLPPPPPPPRQVSVPVPLSLTLDEGVPDGDDEPLPPPTERRPRQVSRATGPERRMSTQIEAATTRSGPVPPPPPLASRPREEEVLDDSDVDPIDPAFYSPQKSAELLVSPPPAGASLGYPTATTAEASAAEPEEEAEEDSEQARRRTIAERMAKLGGIRFGGPPAPAPARRPQPPAPVPEQEEGAERPTSPVAAEQEPEAQELPEEEDEFARKQRIAARIAGMGGQRFGMLPSAAAPPRAPRERQEEAEHAQPALPPPQRPLAVLPRPPVHTTKPQPEDSLSDGEHVELEESDAEEVSREEVPPPVPFRGVRRTSAFEPGRAPPVPQGSRPPVPVPVVSPRSRPPTAMENFSATIPFSYPPPPPPATTRPPTTQYESQGDYVLVGEPESQEPPPPPPPPRTASLRHPPSRAAPSQPPLPPLVAETLNAPPIIPSVDFGGETDLSLSWSEDSTNYPPPALPKSSGKSTSVQLPPDRATSHGEVQLSADDLISQWGRVGVQIAEHATVLFDKSKRALIGDGSYLGFVLAALAAVPNAAQPTPPFESFGYLIYAQTGSAVQRRVSDVMPGDVIVLHDAKLKGHKGLQSYHQHVGADEPVIAIVTDYEVKKAKVKTFQANQHVGHQSVESVSYRLEDLKSGSIKIFRVLEA